MVTKYCPRCKKDVPVANWTRNKKTCDGLAGWCKTCYNEAIREISQRNRKNILAALGGKCVRCGFDDWRALQIDHVHGGGSADPMRSRCTSKLFYEQVLAHRDEFQILCANCNAIKRIENGEHGIPGRRRQQEPMSESEYIPGPGRPNNLQQWYDTASKEDVAAVNKKATECRELARTVGKKKKKWEWLTADKIQEIRRRLEAGESQKAIAKDFGIAQSTVSRISTKER
jgi:hypothetical protein